jgi:hypothetical protein
MDLLCVIFDKERNAQKKRVCNAGKKLGHLKTC